MSDYDEHYLKKELYQLIGSDPDIFDFLQTGSLDGIWYWDLEFPENEWMSERFWELLGYDPAEKKHRTSEWKELIHPDDFEVAIQNLELHCKDASHPYDQVVRYRHQNGSVIWMRCRGLALRDKSGRAVRMLGAHNDITAQKRAEEVVQFKAQELEKLNQHLKGLAVRDELTGLYNRRGLKEKVDWIIKNSRRKKEYFSVLLIDIDKFKSINDKFGHTNGDKVLQMMAAVITNVCRETDIPARYGGDEFIIAFSDKDPNAALVVAERLRSAIEKSEQTITKVTASIGVATIKPEHSKSKSLQLLEQLIEISDRALYLAKKSGRNQIYHIHPVK